MTCQQISWNLSELFTSPNDPRISQVITEAKELAEKFEKTYRGKIAYLNADGLLECLKKWKNSELNYLM